MDLLRIRSEQRFINPVDNSRYLANIWLDSRIYSHCLWFVLQEPIFLKYVKAFKRFNIDITSSANYVLLTLMSQLGAPSHTVARPDGAVTSAS